MVFYDVLEMMKKSGTTWENFNPEGAEKVGEVQERIVSFFKVRTILF